MEMEARCVSFEQAAHQVFVWISFATISIGENYFASEREKFGEVRRGWILFAVWAVLCISTDL